MEKVNTSRMVWPHILAGIQEKKARDTHLYTVLLRFVIFMMLEPAIDGSVHR
jgi:hypothetical protein